MKSRNGRFFWVARPPWVRRLGKLAGLFLAYLLFFPDFNYYYRSTRDLNNTAPMARDLVPTTRRIEALVRDPPQFRVVDGTVYLLIRKRPSLSLFMAVFASTEFSWDNTKLQTFASNHVGLSKYWPDPSAPNLGVKWIVPAQ